jgi:hypothetical protein
MTRTGPDHLTVEAFAAVLFAMDGTLATLTDLIPTP